MDVKVVQYLSLRPQYAPKMPNFQNQTLHYCEATLYLPLEIMASALGSPSPSFLELIYGSNMTPVLPYFNSLRIIPAHRKRTSIWIGLMSAAQAGIKTLN